MTHYNDTLSYEWKRNGLRVVMTVRDGATAELIAATRDLFYLFSDAATAGVCEIQDAPPEAVEILSVPHGGDMPLVQLWGDIEVWINGNRHILKSNIFTDCSRVNHQLTLWYEMIDGIQTPRKFTLDDFRVLVSEENTPPANGNGSAPPPRQDNGDKAEYPPYSELEIRNGEEPPLGVNLDEWFPRDSDNDDNAPPPASANTGNADMPHIALFDSKASDHYESKYSGQTVTVDICKIANMYRTKKDGSSAYQIFEFYPFYEAHGHDVMPSVYPAYTLNTFPPRNKDQWNWKGYKELRELVPEPGDSVDGHFVCKFKLNTAKDGRIFWNVCGIEAVGEIDSTTMQEEAPDFADVPEDEIPF